MATSKRHSPEQVVRKLTQSDRMLAETKDIAEPRAGTVNSRRSFSSASATSIDGSGPPAPEPPREEPPPIPARSLRHTLQIDE